jgi:ribosomal protein S18 acetylase RimI-like enzyme
LQPDDEPAVDALVAADLGGRMQARRGELVDVVALGGFGAWDGDDLVGVATESGDELAALVVASSRRREGIGSALLDAASATWLVTTNDNIDAIRLYQRHGFRIAELHIGGADRSRELKPQIPVMGQNGIEMHDELVLRRVL